MRHLGGRDTAPASKSAAALSELAVSSRPPPPLFIFNLVMLLLWCFFYLWTQSLSGLLDCCSRRCVLQELSLFRAPPGAQSLCH